MKYKSHFLTLFLTIGFLLISNGNYACGMKSGSSCCKSETTSKTEKKECCKEKKSNEKNKPCGGKCGHSNCTTSSISFSSVLNNDVIFNENTLVFSIEKQKFYHYETTISSGFLSLWLIPKIS